MFELLELLFVEPFKGDSLTRQDLGLPANWNIVHRWIDESRFIGESGQKILEPLSVKNSEIVILDSYVKTPNKQFWNSFPKNYPSKLRHSIKTKVLKSYVQKCWFLWTRSQRGIAKKALRRAEGKERVPLKKILQNQSYYSSLASGMSEGDLGYFVEPMIPCPKVGCP